jgi:predicted PurR-regulated permease PerM
MPAPDQDLNKFPPPWNYLIPLARRALIWGVFFALLFLLRRFLLLVFLTFVFAYICDHGVSALQSRIASRRWRASLVMIGMLAVIGLVAYLLGPELKNQAVTFVKKAPEYEQAIEKQLAEWRASNDFLRNFLEGVEAKGILQELLAGSGDEPHAVARLHRAVVVFRDAASVTTSFLLSLLFAFLIVGDLPRISRGIQSLRQTRLATFYDEVANTVFRFGQVLGRFLEAQLLIAIVNTALTSVGMVLLGVPQVAFLAGFVFLCSFIPVAGVFISTSPICIVALGTGGFGLVLWVIAMVTVVHIVEAYILNPLIMGAHLHLNPVLVLAVLLIGHQMFGVWGLLLGVPTVTYVFGYAIRLRDHDDDEDRGAGPTGSRLEAAARRTP